MAASIVVWLHGSGKSMIKAANYLTRLCHHFGLDQGVAMPCIEELLSQDGLGWFQKD
jgi:hypothetical protein